MLDLGKIRDEIDVTDDEIVRLFQHRMALTAEVAQYKIETGKAVFDAERERQKLEKLTGEGTNAFNTKGRGCIMHPLPIDKQIINPKKLVFRRTSRTYMTKMPTTTTDHTDGLAAAVHSKMGHVRPSAFL